MTDPAPETARALLWRHGLPEDVIDGALCLYAQELAAVQRREADDLHQTEPGVAKGLRIGANLIHSTHDTVPAAGCVVPAAPTQADLRDRIAETMARADGWEWAAANFSTLSTPAADRYRRCAEAVLAVLPPPADRGALLAAADWFDSGGRSVSRMFGHQVGAELRRVADEALVDAGAAAIWALYSDAEPSRTGLVLANPHAAADAVLAVLPPATDRGALERVRAVLETEAVVGRSALEYRGLILSALMADEAPPPSPRCTCGETACESELCDCDLAPCPVDHAVEAQQQPDTETDCCGAEPPTRADDPSSQWGDCWCTLPPGHDGEHRCEPCTDRHGAPGWSDAPAVLGPRAADNKRNEAETLPLLFWDESAGATHHDGQITLWINKGVNLAQFAPAGKLILQVQGARALRDALNGALADVPRFNIFQAAREAVRQARGDEAAPQTPILFAQNDDSVIEPSCEGFPDTCPNKVDVPPAPPHHNGGVRCGCYDDDKESYTLPAWLYHRYGCTGQGAKRPWVDLSDDDQSYWVHQAHAVRRAVARGGFKNPHIYLSTGCLHDDHDYCKSMTGLNGRKRPGECKMCGARCVCHCHDKGDTT